VKTHDPTVDAKPCALALHLRILTSSRGRSTGQLVTIIAHRITGVDNPHMSLPVTVSLGATQRTKRTDRNRRTASTHLFDSKIYWLENGGQLINSPVAHAPSLQLMAPSMATALMRPSWSRFIVARATDRSRRSRPLVRRNRRGIWPVASSSGIGSIVEVAALAPR
jgi:hypothetical protein